MIMTDEDIEALGHRIAWRYKKSSDPHHSDTYTFNRATLLQFSEAVEKAVAAAVAKRCADLCAATGQIAADMYGDGAECISTADMCANAIRREFGEAGNG